MSKCIGCGIKLQTTDPNGAGYVKEIVLIENEPLIFPIYILIIIS